MLLELNVEERNRLIGKNLRKYRLLKGLTQDELAEGLCSMSQLSKVENGKTYLNRTLLRQMADRLGVTVDRIEAVDAVLEELTEQLQLAKDARTAAHYDKATELVREVMVKSQAFGYRNLLIDGILLECRLSIDTTQYERAIKHANQALEEDLAQESTQKVRLLYELGHAYQLSGNVIAAYDCYSRADEEFEASDGNEELRLPILFNLSQCHYRMRNYRTAIRYVEKAEMLAHKLSRFMYRIRLSYMKAVYLEQVGDMDKAVAINMSTLKEAQENSLLLDEAIIHNNMGQLFLNKNEIGQADAHLKRAKMLFELLNEDLYLSSTFIHFAELHICNKEWSQAIQVLDNCDTLVSRIKVNSYREKAKVLVLRAQIERARGNFDAYVSYMEEALHVYDQHRVLIESYEVASELAEDLYQQGDPRALGAYRRAMEYNNKSLEFGMRR